MDQHNKVRLQGVLLHSFGTYLGVPMLSAAYLLLKPDSKGIDDWSFIPVYGLLFSPVAFITVVYGALLGALVMTFGMKSPRLRWWFALSVMLSWASSLAVLFAMDLL